MSSRKIKKLLEAKGFEVVSVKYIRNAVTPSGYGKGYDIEMVSSEEFEDLVYYADPSADFYQYKELGCFDEVCEWIGQLPDMKRQAQGES